MFWTKLFPTILIVLDICAGVAWTAQKSPRWAIYWFAAAVLSFAVTWLDK